jgi:hypothetical protein
MSVVLHGLCRSLIGCVVRVCVFWIVWNCVFNCMNSDIVFFSIVGAVATQRVSGGYHVAFNSFAGGDSVVCFSGHLFSEIHVSRVTGVRLQRQHEKNCSADRPRHASVLIQSIMPHAFA